MNKTALVLSAGGMFGSWQMGVWRAISSRIKPDVVVGTSAGALNGWAIAGGADPEELEQAWLDAELADIIRVRFPGKSLFDQARMNRVAQEVFRRFSPQLPFVLTVVEVPRLRQRMVRGEDVVWQHLAATCSIPLGFPPQRIGGKRYVDGGLLDILPVWAAAEMGAGRVIALDALPQLPSRVIGHSVRMFRRLATPPRVPQDLEITSIRPGCVLGRLRDALFWNRDNASRWIAQGEADGRAWLSRL